MLRAEYSRKLLKFKETAITSRSKMNDKETFIIHVTDDDIPGATGTGECALFRGLSAEDTPDYERQLEYACNSPESLPAIINTLRIRDCIARYAKRRCGAFHNKQLHRRHHPHTYQRAYLDG